MKKLLSILMASVMMMGALTACGTDKGDSKVENAFTSENLAEVLTSVRDEETNEYNPPVLVGTEDADNMYEFFGFAKENYEFGALSISMMNIKAYGVAIVKPAADKTDAVVADFNAYVERTQKSFEQYLIDQYEVAQNAIVEVLDNGLVVMVMCENSQEVYDNIVAAF